MFRRAVRVLVLTRFLQILADCKELTNEKLTMMASEIDDRDFFYSAHSLGYKTYGTGGFMGDSEKVWPVTEQRGALRRDIVSDAAPGLQQGRVSKVFSHATVSKRLVLCWLELAILQSQLLPCSATQLPSSSFSPLSTAGYPFLPFTEVSVMLLFTVMVHLAFLVWFRKPQRRTLAREPPLVAAAPASSARHVMISYKWGAHADRVRQCASELKALGHDIWIDVQGSSVMDSMMRGQTTGDVMCRAVGLASHVIVFVEQDYMTSPNCMLEFTWATQREKNRELCMIYVMLQPGCTPCNIPDDAEIKLHKIWMHIGDKVYHECFNDTEIPSVVANVSECLRKMF